MSRVAAAVHIDVGMMGTGTEAEADEVKLELEVDAVDDEYEKDGFAATTSDTTTFTETVTSANDLRASATLQLEDEDDYGNGNGNDSEKDVPTMDDSGPDADADVPSIDSNVPPLLETNELKDNVDHARAAASIHPTSTTTTTTTTTAGGETKRLWGSTGSSNDAASVLPAGSSSSQSNNNNGGNRSTGTAATGAGAGSTPTTDSNNSSTTAPQQQQNLPFIPSSSSSSTSKQANQQQHPQQKQQHHHKPPEGFVLAARVYTDPVDRLSHFDKDPAALTLTYWDCGVAGSTTPYINVKHAYFRHALAATTTVISSNDSYSYSGSSSSHYSNPDSMHPVLVVALTPVTMEVNSGTVQHFQPGDVILLEDVLRPGHKMRPSHPYQNHPQQHQHHPADVQLLFLTMPHPYHHTGKDHVSMAALASNNRLAVQKNPCPANTNTISQQASGTSSDSDSSGTSTSATTTQSDTTSPLESSGGTAFGTIDRPSGTKSGSSSSRPFLVYQPPPSPFTQWWKHPNAGRWVVLGVAGLSVSTLMADFLGKTAPLWLAVGVGGGCFVAASTYSFCQAGNAVWAAAEVWYYQRQLRESQSGTDLDDDDDDDEQYHDDSDGLLQQKSSEEAATPVFEAM